MNIKHRIIVALIVAAPVAARATGGVHPMGGCGLGYLLFSEKQDKGSQILAATTNGTFYSQTFGISSGTSGCTEDGAVKLVRRLEAFTEANFANLRRDISAGRGEYLDSFASLLGVKESDRPELIRFLHAEYASLFPAPTTTPDQMLSTLMLKLSRRPDLAS